MTPEMTAPSGPQPDRRTQPRVDAKIQVRLAPDTGSGSLDAQNLDLSWGGASLLLPDTRLQVGESIKLEFPWTPGRSFYARAEVVRCQEVDEGFVAGDPLGLADEALDAARLDQIDMGADAGDRVDLAADALAECLHAVHAVGEELGADLDLDVDLVERAGAGDLDEVVRRGALDPQQRLLDLGGEDVDAADDQHVVGAPGDAAHACRASPAGTGLAVEAGDVAGAIADQRHRLAGERGDHQLAGLAFRDRLERLRVQTLDQEMILLDVHPGALGHSPLTPGPITSERP
jgi:hypothetical protein